MGMLERLGLKAPTPTRELVRPLERNPFDVSTEVRRATAWALALPPSSVWNTQPYVRTVVTFLARNIAQLGVHTFQRVDDTQRERLRDHPVARVLSRPNKTTTSFELIFGLVCDKALYERAYWLIGRDNEGNDTLTRIPPSRVTQHIADDPLGQIEAFHVANVSNGSGVDVPAERVLYFPGWNPTTSVGMPSSPLDAIKSVIAEQAASFEFRKQAWANGLQATGSIERPTGVPWKEGARERFITDMRDQLSGDGPRRGGFVLLEDGMKLNTQQFNAREAEWIEAAKLSLALVASIYHVNPTMVGLLDNANYSNVREFRKMLYGDTLGPIMASIEDRLNTFLVPRLDDSGDVYVEFNIAEKMQGDFEEQAAAMQTSVGAPWMTRAEARARLNLPPVDDADQLVVPLNVLVGGQASPRDSAPPAAASRTLKSVDVEHDDKQELAELAHQLARFNDISFDEALALLSKAKSEPVKSLQSNVVSFKARVDEQQHRKIAEVFASYFGKQARSVLSRLGAGDADWWDGERWDRELADMLHPLAVQLAAALGRREAERLGFDASEYDDARTVAFLRNTAEHYASNVNATTKQQLDDAIDADDSDPADVFETAKSSRADGIAVAFGTFAAGFAMREAASQIAERNNVEPTKTWVTGSNARPEHARLNGETVPIDEPFSNGMQWPAQFGNADQVAGCNCHIEISI